MVRDSTGFQISYTRTAEAATAAAAKVAKAAVERKGPTAMCLMMMDKATRSPGSDADGAADATD